MKTIVRYVDIKNIPIDQLKRCDYCKQHDLSNKHIAVFEIITNGKSTYLEPKYTLIKLLELGEIAYDLNQVPTKDPLMVNEYKLIYFDKTTKAVIGTEDDSQYQLIKNFINKRKYETKEYLSERDMIALNDWVVNLYDKNLHNVSRVEI